MADDEFNIDELISGPDESENDVVHETTRNTSTTDNTSGTLQPFSVRLDEEYVEVIKALAWWKRISQREFLENCITYALEKMDEDRIKKILKRHKSKNVQ